MTISLTEEYIARKLRLAYRPGTVASIDGPYKWDEDSNLKCAAVLIPMARVDNDWQVVYTRRTETVETHKGQVSFPGGGCDIGELTPETTALREAQEEIGLAAKDVHILGRLNDVITITRYRITPVVGVFPWPYTFRLESKEVARIFTIPLQWLARGENWEEKPFTPAGVKRPVLVINYHKFDGELLWGISARITHNFLAVLGL